MIKKEVVLFNSFLHRGLKELILIKRRGWVAVLITVIAMHLNAAKAFSSDLKEQVADLQIKALFLYNFANFVHWPNQAFRDRSSPLRLCLVGYVPFGGILDNVDGTLIGDRELSVYRANSREDPVIQSGCHILFVGLDKMSEIEEIFKNINHTFVFSVGDQPGFAEDWGTVNIFRVRDGAQLAINLRRVTESGLTVSSDLLAIARVIHCDVCSDRNAR